ncbi:hypothetical protein BDW66DRAFT_155603 [Aspergillus desertorum]
MSTVIMAQTRGEGAAREMSPAAFLWLPDRALGAAYDNNFPCRSHSTKLGFSLVNLANVFALYAINGHYIVIKYESWNGQITICDKNNSNEQKTLKPSSPRHALAT